MHENAKLNPSSVFMYFQKIYIYSNNTKKKFYSLTEKDTKKKKFKWSVSKLFCISKSPITQLDRELINDLLINGPDFKEETQGINKTNTGLKKNDEIVIYTAHPITPYDLKLLLNLVGIRMIHFVNK